VRCCPVFLSFGINKTSMHYQLSSVITNNNTLCIVISPYTFILRDLQHTKRFRWYRFVNPFRSLRNPKQDRQYTCNVTLRGVRSTTATVEKLKVLHILSVCL